MLNVKNNIKELKKYSTEIFGIEEVKETLLLNKKKLIVKVGFDPTTPDLHLGHFLLIQKMQQLQKIGHIIVFLIGDFTTMIGDPTGRNICRKKITKKEIKDNYEKYHIIIRKFLDKKKTKIINNSFWLNKLNAENIINLTSKTTVAQLLKRNDFTQRYNNNIAINLHEFIYPLLQGFDSIAIKADVEIGGIDQKFNLLLGRELQKTFNQKQQIIILLPLLLGLDGIHKMSKSLGNHIKLDEVPTEIFGKIMSISDVLMWEYCITLNIYTNKMVQQYRKKDINLNPRDLKMNLAYTIVKKLHNIQDAEQAKQNFIERFVKKKIPEDIKIYTLKCEDTSTEIPLIFALKQLNITKSTSDGIRLVKQKAIRTNGKITLDSKTMLYKNSDTIINVGKKIIVLIRVT